MVRILQCQRAENCRADVKRPGDADTTGPWKRSGPQREILMADRALRCVERGLYETRGIALVSNVPVGSMNGVIPLER